MSITYPLSLPATPGFSEVRFRARQKVGISESDFTFQPQVYEWEGERWECDCVLPPMVRADAEAWIAFLLALRGHGGTFLLGPGSYASSPRGNPGGPVLINGAGQLGTTVNVKGMTPTTGNFLAGDWLSFGDTVERLFKNLTDATADGSGNATLDIWPRLRVATVNDDPVTVNSPKGVFRLASVAEWNVDTARHHGIEFQAIEA